MATERDPTTRLRQLPARRTPAPILTPTSDRGGGDAPADELPAGAVADVVRGWVPSWSDDAAPRRPRRVAADDGRHRHHRRTRGRPDGPLRIQDEPPEDPWPPDDAGVDPADDDHVAFDGPEPFGGPGSLDAPTEPGAGAATGRRVHRPALRWNRLRDRWVPEPLQHARVDPGRRGSLLLSLVAAAGAVVAAIGVWSHSAAATAPAPSITTTLPVVSSLAPVTPVAQTASPTPSSTEPEIIVVSVTGAVVTPGIVSLPAGARVADAIAAAGGVLAGTDYTGLNLASRLAVGDAVVVGGTTQGVASAAVPGGPGSGTTSGTAGALVDLNTADQATLETLPGVGPVMAANILAWRDANGGFTAVDQLQEITGIGPARYATLAPLVTV